MSLFTGSYSIRQINPLEKVKFKYVQWLSLAIGLVCLMLGFTRIAKYSFFSIRVWGFLILGIISLLIWLKISWSDKAALISPQLFKNLRFSMQLIAYCFAKIATLALDFIFPIYVQAVNHGSVSLAGWVTFPGAVINALMAALAGKLLDKKGARLPIIIGIIASLTSLILMNVLAPLSNLAIVLLYVLYYGGYGMCFGSLMTSGLITLGKASHAQGNAIFNTLQQFSGAVGTALAGTLIALAQNNHVGNGTAVSSKWTFMILLILIIIKLFLALVFVPKKR
ncbi:MFS transporter [uncultured Lactobacillus sp.]|uniref:MFS transporter n=2 Tax=Lactobacillus TaxID=1578 RepID=UPI0026027118|nr:MFS transporter [uncultured Lactobacillus sp.]